MNLDQLPILDFDAVQKGFDGKLEVVGRAKFGLTGATTMEPREFYLLGRGTFDIGCGEEPGLYFSEKANLIDGKLCADGTFFSSIPQRFITDYQPLRG